MKNIFLYFMEIFFLIRETKNVSFRKPNPVKIEVRFWSRTKSKTGNGSKPKTGNVCHRFEQLETGLGLPKDRVENNVEKPPTQKRLGGAPREHLFRKQIVFALAPPSGTESARSRATQNPSGLKPTVARSQCSESRGLGTLLPARQVDIFSTIFSTPSFGHCSQFSQIWQPVGFFSKNDFAVGKIFFPPKTGHCPPTREVPFSGQRNTFFQISESKTFRRGANNFVEKTILH
jgi:hypothetical protein